jgi:integrase
MILQHGGIRKALSLETPLKAAAAARARDTYLAVIAGGWEALKPEKKEHAHTGLTVGRFLAELAQKADLKPKTLEGYAIAFRLIVAGICGIEGDTRKYDHRGGGRARWLERIHAVRLDAITPARVQEWKRAFLARAGKDPVALRSARTSCNSFLRRAKSLFAPSAVKHLSLQLPAPLPFDGIAFEPRQSARYRSTIDPEALTLAASEELAGKDEPVFLAFLLALGAGLRRGEIDRLEWSAFRWDRNVIRIEPTRWFDVKTEHSIGDVPVDPELMSVFRGYAARAHERVHPGMHPPHFVIEGDNLPIASATFENYRAQATFERLSAWLRKHGVTARKPIHELRKEFGSMVNRRHGLTAAKDLLRHADIGITASHYIDSPRQATSGLGVLLAGKVVEFKGDLDAG